MKCPTCGGQRPIGFLAIPCTRCGGCVVVYADTFPRAVKDLAITAGVVVSAAPMRAVLALTRTIRRIDP